MARKVVLQSIVICWDSTRDDKHQNYYQPEDTGHLHRYTDAERTRLLEGMVNSLKKLLYNHHYHPEIAYWLPRYIRLRGTKKLSSFARLSPEITRTTKSQDLIAWKDLMEGSLARSILNLQ